MAGLTFEALRRANQARQREFPNGKGEASLSGPDGTGWGLAQWSNATLGELGEAANIIKKIDRGDFTLDQVREKLARELGDTVVYLDMLAYRAGIDLGGATVLTFNAKSEELLLETRLDADGEWRVPVERLRETGREQPVAPAAAACTCGALPPELHDRECPLAAEIDEAAPPARAGARGPGSTRLPSYADGDDMLGWPSGRAPECTCNDADPARAADCPAHGQSGGCTCGARLARDLHKPGCPLRRGAGLSARPDGSA